MSNLVPSDEIEDIVGAKRHATDHIGRANSEDQQVYILHSQACLESGRDVRLCPYSLGIDGGIELSEWEEDVPHVLKVEADQDPHSDQRLYVSPKEKV